MAQANIGLKKYASLEDASNAGEFYLVNNSDATRPGEEKRKKGVLIINYRTSASGASRNIYVPPTWIPLNLKDYADTSDLSKIDVLRDFVRRNIVVLIDKQSYDMLVKHPKYSEEFQKYAEKLGMVAAPTGGTQDFSLNLTSPRNAAFDIEPVETPIGVQIVEAADNDDQLVMLFDQSLGGLSSGELSYILSKSLPASLLQAISAELSQMQKDGKEFPKTVKTTNAYQDYLRSSSSQPNFNFT